MIEGEIKTRFLVSKHKKHKKQNIPLSRRELTLYKKRKWWLKSAYLAVKFPRRCAPSAIRLKVGMAPFTIPGIQCFNVIPSWWCSTWWTWWRGSPQPSLAYLWIGLGLTSLMQQVHHGRDVIPCDPPPSCCKHPGRAGSHRDRADPIIWSKNIYTWCNTSSYIHL